MVWGWLLAKKCMVVVCTFYLSLIHVLSNLNFELLKECFWWCHLTVWLLRRREKEKEHHISLLLHTITTMNAFFATFSYPPPLLPLPPLSPSNVILLRNHLRPHPLLPCSKEQPRMTTRTGGGSAASTASVSVIAIISPIPSPGQHLGVPCHGLK